MDYPKLGRSPSYTVSVPALSGGVNLSAGPNFVEDNQLTACKNLYWREGALRTRPGIQYASSHSLVGAPNNDLVCNVTLEWEGVPVRCVATKTRPSPSQYLLQIFLFPPDGSIQTAFPITINDTAADGLHNLLVFPGPATTGRGLYALVALTSRTLVYELTDSGWQELDEEDVYAPLVLVNGKGDAYDQLPADSKTEAAPATMFESFNTLFGRFRASFYADGQSTSFQLPAAGLSDAAIHIQYGDYAGANTRTTIPAGQTDSPPGLLVTSGFARVNRETGVISFFYDVENQEQPLALPAIQNLSNSLVITASVPVDASGGGGLGSPARMRQAVWFGGTSLAGGSRLFLAGDPSAPGMVRWSDCARPLYFPENNYAQVGGAEPITAMAKQNDMLVFFKSREIYATSYVEGASYTADDLLAGNVFDVTAAAASFPITQLHPSIGCDRPDSIQLCDNRLVFVHSDGCIYLLTAADAHSENNVYCLSDPIRGAVPTDQGLFSADWNGYYLLFQPDGPIVAMDYRSYGYRYASSYARNKTDVPFFLWENPVDNCMAASSAGGQVCLVRTGGSENGLSTLYAYRLDGDADQIGPSQTPTPIASEFCTKLFDFDQPHRQKRISAVHLGAGGDGRMELYFLTQRGSTDTVRQRELHTGQTGQAGYLSTLSVCAPAARVQQFGVGVRAYGIAAFDGISIQYTILR